MFSCVVPVKGVRPYLDAAIASLHAQGMDDELEIIIQDADVEPDAGLSDALNKGFAKAKGEWLFWLNADDVLLPGALEKVREVGVGVESGSGSGSGRGSGREELNHHCPTRTLNSRLPCWIAGNDVFIDAEGKIIRCAWDRGWKCCYDGLLAQVYGPSAFFRRELLQQVGGFDTSLKYAMDVDMWCRFRRAGYWYHKLPRYVWGFRVHEGSVTHSIAEGAWSDRHAEENVRVCAKCGFAESASAKKIARAVRLLNGSYLKACLDTMRYAGRDWKGVDFN